MTVIILAAGFSSRMEGKNKMLLPFHNLPLIISTINNAKQYCPNIVVVLGHEADRIKSILPPFVKTVFNPNYAQGQGTSLQAGLQAINDDCMIVPGDLPLITPFDYQRIEKALETAPCARPSFNNIYGHPVGIRNELRAQIVEEKILDIKNFLSENGLQITMGSLNTITDIDTPQAYSKLISN